MSIIFPPAMLGSEMAAPILWAPRILLFLQENLHAHKIPRFGGGGNLGGKGGRTANYFLWARGVFLNCHPGRICCRNNSAGNSNLQFPATVWNEYEGEFSYCNFLHEGLEGIQGEGLLSTILIAESWPKFQELRSMSDNDYLGIGRSYLINSFRSVTVSVTSPKLIQKKLRIGNFLDPELSVKGRERG